MQLHLSEKGSGQFYSFPGSCLGLSGIIIKHNGEEIR